MSPGRLKNAPEGERTYFFKFLVIPKFTLFWHEWATLRQTLGKQKQNVDARWKCVCFILSRAITSLMLSEIPRLPNIYQEIDPTNWPHINVEQIAISTIRHPI